MVARCGAGADERVGVRGDSVASNADERRCSAVAACYHPVLDGAPSDYKLLRQDSVPLLSSVSLSSASAKGVCRCLAGGHVINWLLRLLWRCTASPQAALVVKSLTILRDFAEDLPSLERALFLPGPSLFGAGNGGRRLRLHFAPAVSAKPRLFRLD